MRAFMEGATPSSAGRSCLPPNLAVPAGFVGGRGMPGEGINHEDIIIPRKEMCHALLMLALDQNCLMIKAPPYSGKTSMLQLLHKTAQREVQQFMGGKVYSFNAARVTENHKFDKAWRRNFGVSWEDVCYPAQSAQDQQQRQTCLVLVDETQVLYDQERTCSHAFWRAVKEIAAGSDTDAMDWSPEGYTSPRVVIIMVAAYGSQQVVADPPPVLFPDSACVLMRPTGAYDKELLGARPRPCLQLEPAEVDELFGRYCNGLGWRREDLHGLKDFLAMRSDSQPGLLSILLKRVDAFDFKSFSSPDDAKKSFLAHMGTGSFLDSLNDYRNFVRYHYIVNFPKCMEVMKKVADSYFEADLYVFSEAERDALYQLVHMGQLVVDGDTTVRFPSTLHAENFMSKDRTLTMSLQNCTLCAFLRTLVLPGMSAGRLKKLVRASRGGRLSGRQFLLEFYRAALLVTPSDCSLSPDIGALFGVHGYLDYLLLPQGWGFKLFKEGIAIDGHQKRPEQRDRYQELFDLDIMQKAAIIDFRVQKLDLKRTCKTGKLYYVVLKKEKGFKEATLHDAQTGDEWPIKLAP